jgi:hypothetical protein
MIFESYFFQGGFMSKMAFVISMVVAFAALGETNKQSYPQVKEHASTKGTSTWRKEKASDIGYPQKRESASAKGTSTWHKEKVSDANYPQTGENASAKGTSTWH